MNDLDVTRILQELEDGDQQASDRLLEAVYDELRRLAAQRLAHERPGQTLQATALVHEAWLRLVRGSGGEDPGWQSRAHFFGAAAQAMRRILVEQARRKGRVKHGGGHERIGMEEAELRRAEIVASTTDIDLVALDSALDALAEESARKAELVKLRYFTGLTIEQASEVLGISRATADRDWAYAKAWLFQWIRSGA